MEQYSVEFLELMNQRRVQRAGSKLNLLLTNAQWEKRALTGVEANNLCNSFGLRFQDLILFCHWLGVKIDMPAFVEELLKDYENSKKIKRLPVAQSLADELSEVLIEEKE